MRSVFGRLRPEGDVSVEPGVVRGRMVYQESVLLKLSVTDNPVGIGRVLAIPFGRGAFPRCELAGLIHDGRCGGAADLAGVGGPSRPQ